MFLPKVGEGEPLYVGFFHTGAYQDQISGYGGIKHCLIPSPKHIIVGHAKIIGHTPEMITAIVWIKKMAPQEVHHNEIERFLIIEGSCDIFIEDEVYQLKAGDMLSIPLHKPHSLQVTSAIPCKVILQRIAA